MSLPRHACIPLPKTLAAHQPKTLSLPQDAAVAQSKAAHAAPGAWRRPHRPARRRHPPAQHPQPEKSRQAAAEQAVATRLRRQHVAAARARLHLAAAGGAAAAAGGRVAPRARPGAQPAAAGPLHTAAAPPTTVALTGQARGLCRKAIWHQLKRSAGVPEAVFSARACLRLPQASASPGQSAAWAALAPWPHPACFDLKTPLFLNTGTHRRRRRR